MGFKSSITIGSRLLFPTELPPLELNNVNTNLDDEKKKTITDLIYSYFFYLGVMEK